MFVQDVAAGIRCLLSVETSEGAAGCSLVQTVDRNCLWHALHCWCWGCDLPVYKCMLIVSTLLLTPGASRDTTVHHPLLASSFA